jgi:cytidine deaminase
MSEKQNQPAGGRVSAETLGRMLGIARAASERAYAPYSKFSVGAALLDEQWRIHDGCNVENSSYGLSMCAERVAVGKLICAGGKRIVATVIYAPTESLTPPCGACRQVLSEFADNSAEVHLFNLQGERHVTTMERLLPEKFRLETS